MTRVASPPGSAEPLVAITRSARCRGGGSPARRARAAAGASPARRRAPSRRARRSPAASPPRRSGGAGRASTTARSPSTRCANPQEWNSGAAMSVRPRARSGITASSAAAGSIVAGWWRRAPRGVPVVPLVRMTIRPESAGGSRSAGSPSREPVDARHAAPRALRPLGPRDVALAAARPPRRAAGELLVVDDRARHLPRADRRDLGRGERRVEKEDVGAELRARDGRLDEAAVVATQDRHDVAGLEAVGSPARSRARWSGGAGRRTSAIRARRRARAPRGSGWPTRRSPRPVSGPSGAAPSARARRRPGARAGRPRPA